jgi:hypothetical protein
MNNETVKATLAEEAKHEDKKNSQPAVDSFYSTIGGSVGGTIGGVVGSVVPGLGTALGANGGAAIGGSLGYLLSRMAASYGYTGYLGVPRFIGASLTEIKNFIIPSQDNEPVNQNIPDPILNSTSKMLTRMPRNHSEQRSYSTLDAEKIISEVVIPVLSQVSSNKARIKPVESQEEESSFRLR